MGAEISSRNRSIIAKSDKSSSELSNSNLSMERLRRTLSLHHKKKENSTNKNEKKPIQWYDDNKLVRDGTCNFNVKYLGSIEVHESRGMYVCEQAIQALLSRKGKHIKAILYISGNALRVVDETNKTLIVDQTIEKVSFCAPDRYHNKGFAYIYRDGTTRRWLCHAFLSIKETGERVSHAVGCAFQVCLEQKQKRDRQCNVIVEYTSDGTSFTRFGSFRSTSITERIMDPQSAIVPEPIPYTTPMVKSNFIERPRPKGSKSDTVIRSVLMRSEDLNQTTIGIFKRQTSLGSSNLSSIQRLRYKHSLATTISEEIESPSITNECSKISSVNSTNM